MLGGQRILGALRNVGTPDLRDGQQIERYAPTTTPEELVKDIEGML